jgi:hypothetical protein
MSNIVKFSKTRAQQHAPSSLSQSKSPKEADAREKTPDAPEKETLVWRDRDVSEIPDWINNGG